MRFPGVVTGLALVVLSTLVAGCNKPGATPNELIPEPPEAARLRESLGEWQVLKAAHGGHYEYEVHFSSWVGFSDVTTLEVEGDDVVRRRYEARDAEGQVTERCTEEGAELGTHEHGAPLRTIEDLYAECRRKVLTQDRRENDIYLEFRYDEVLRYCFYVPKNCADDCSRGVSINALRFLTIDPEAFALTTDRDAYLATCTNDVLLECCFTLTATYHNRTDQTVYLHRCLPDSEYPRYLMPVVDSAEESAYHGPGACVGHDNHIEVLPGKTRQDVLEIRGPTSFDGVTGEHLGLIEGTFQLSYDAYPCAEEGDCEHLPKAQRFSAPFEVTVSGSDVEDLVGEHER